MPATVFPARTSHLAADWPPAEEYPVVVSIGMSADVELVDFGRTLSMPLASDVVAEAGRVIRALLRERSAQGLMMPYPSSRESLKDRTGIVTMIPTAGWNILEEDQPE